MIVSLSFFSHKQSLMPPKDLLVLSGKQMKISARPYPTFIHKYEWMCASFEALVGVKVLEKLFNP